MTITFHFIHGDDNEENEDYEEYYEKYETEKAAAEAWSFQTRAYVQGESEDTIAGVYFDDDDVDVELELRFDEYDWDDIIELRDEQLGE